MAPVLDPVLHQPVRTRIVAYLAARGRASFSELKTVLDVTDGNLEAHLKKLVAAGYVEGQRSDEAGRPQTIYTMSDGGLEQFRDYVKTLQSMLDNDGT